jgi:signal transduction histidine kinase
VRLATLLDGLLTLAREGGTAPSAHPVDLAAAAAGAADRWLAHGRDIDVSGDRPVVALASEDDVATILDSLVGNALAYSSAGTPVAIEWGIEAGQGYVAVLDRGPGVAPGEEEAVFERFRRGAASHGGPSGTGLGLAIARTLAARWGGTVTIANRPGGGARAELRLPAGEQPLDRDGWLREEKVSL